MKLLVLGGTVFLGRHVVQQALAAGHEVTLLHRGQHGAGLFPQARTLRGDRDGDMSALHGQRFDAVIDCSGYTAPQLRRSAQALAEGAGHYVFISSISVCAAFPPHRRFDEAAPVAAGDEGYGAGKARAEEAIEAALPGAVAHVRPGLIVGPHDPTGRFTYWVRRAARGGAMLAPGRPQRSVQFIDVRDLAQWCLQLAQQRVAGVFNAVGPDLTMAEFLAHCGAAAGNDAHPVWASDEHLLAADVEPWTGLPLWIPESDAEFGGMLLADNHRAVAAGLRTRPVSETVTDTLAWARAEPVAATGSVAALPPEREAQLLAGLARA
jgi:2'-hydroxyisoflavone reductase